MPTQVRRLQGARQAEQALPRQAARRAGGRGGAARVRPLRRGRPRGRRAAAGPAPRARGRRLRRAGAPLRGGAAARAGARGPDEGRDAEALDPGVATVREFRPAEPAAGLRHAFDVVRGRGAQNVLDADSVYVAHARTSKYDPLSSCLVDFRARAAVASVKNFQLVASAPVEAHERRAYYDRDGEGRGLADDDAALPVVLQMGKVGKDCFNMDYTFPFSMLQAFAVCLARFDTGVPLATTR